MSAKSIAPLLVTLSLLCASAAYGTTVQVGPNGPATIAQAVASLNRMDGVSDVIRVTSDTLEVETVHIDCRKGATDPLLLEGHHPDGRSPVARFADSIGDYAVQITIADGADVRISNLTLVPVSASGLEKDAEQANAFRHGAVQITDSRVAKKDSILEPLRNVQVSLRGVTVTSSRPGGEPVAPSQRLFRYEKHARWAGAAGIVVALKAGLAGKSDLSFVDCHVSHVDSVGYAIRNGTGAKVSLTRCGVHFANAAGLEARASDGGLSLSEFQSTWNEGHGIYFVDGVGALDLTDCRISNNRARGLAIGSGRGPVPSRINVRGGSYSENGYTDYYLASTFDYGILLWGGTKTVLDIRGTADQPVLFVRNASRGLRIDNPHAQIERIEHAVFVGRHRYEGLNVEQADLSNNPVIAHCLFAGNAFKSNLNTQLSIGATNHDAAKITISDCTFYDAAGEKCSHVAVDSYGDCATKNLTLDFQRCIFAGGPAHRGGDEIAVRLDGTNCVARFTDCGLVTEGPHAINSSYALCDFASDGGNKVVEEGTIHADPNFSPSDYSGTDASALASTSEFFRPRSNAYRSNDSRRADLAGYSATVGDDAPPVEPIRVAVFADYGPDVVDIYQTVRTLRGSTEITFDEIVASDIWQGALNEYDVIMFPGGSSAGEANSLKAKGRALLMDFIEAGGGYIGTCAGCYLATNRSDGLFLDMCKADRIDDKNWARGHGIVQLEMTPAGRRLLGTGATELIEYWQGPLMRPTSDATPTNYIPLARFATEIHDKGAPSGVMVGTDAIVVGHHAQGRYVAISPHPEGVITPLFQGDFIIRLVKWAAGRADLPTPQDSLSATPTNQPAAE